MNTFLLLLSLSSKAQLL